MWFARRPTDQRYLDDHGELPVEDTRPRCAACLGAFTDDEWADRHDGFDPLEDPIHARCCREKGPCKDAIGHGESA